MPKIVILLAIIVIPILFLLFANNNNPNWLEPEVLRSKDGILELSLDAKKSKVLVGGNEKESNTWNEKYLGSTWEVKGGDTIKVHLKNNLSEPTNLHFHGSHVSPKGNSDNVLLSIKPEEEFEYEYKLPENHPPGLYWYHPHLHPYVEDQVIGGMAGAIKVRGVIDELDGVKGVPERLLILTTQESNNPNNPVRLVNNTLNPMLYVRPFETIRLQVLNASADDFYNLSIPGYKLNIISRDGNTLSHVQSVDSELMGPGDRVELLFKANLWGEVEIQSKAFDQGFAKYETSTFMKIKVAGVPVIPKKLPVELIQFDDLADAKIDKIRTLTFSMGGSKDNPTFLFDGQEYNANEVNQIMELGATEEWKLVNESNEVHPFHIHINPFQVISINGEKVDRPGYDDTFPIPAKSTVVIKTRYLDFDGKYVLHCHILFHEDHGMMQIVEVVKPGEESAADNGLPDREDMAGMDHAVESGSNRYNQNNHLGH